LGICMLSGSRPFFIGLRTRFVIVSIYTMTTMKILARSKSRPPIKALEAHEELEKASNSKTKTPEKFQPHSLCGWTCLNHKLENYLMSLRGILCMPLIYMIRKEENNNVTPPGEDAIQEFLHLVPLEGPIYLEDKWHIYCIIRDGYCNWDQRVYMDARHYK